MMENSNYSNTEEIRTSESTAKVQIGNKAANVTLFRNVYLWMALALFITGITALKVASTPVLYEAILGSRALFFGLIIAELALVFILSARIMRMSFLTATMMFIGYSVLNGATLSVIFLIYTTSSIASTFFITAGTFGAMALVGFFTKKDLSSMGSIAFMGLIGLIIASIVNMFLRSEMMMWVISYIGVAVFVALTAYDSQKIKRMVLEAEVVDDTTQKIALLGSLTLYLDFINLFLYLLRIFGGRK